MSANGFSRSTTPPSASTQRTSPYGSRSLLTPGPLSTSTASSSPTTSLTSSSSAFKPPKPYPHPQSSFLAIDSHAGDLKIRDCRFLGSDSDRYLRHLRGAKHNREYHDPSVARVSARAADLGQDANRQLGRCLVAKRSHRCSI